MKSVFISHSSKDKAIADKIVESLENVGVSAWIAPRDVPAGSEYGASILKAIRECTVFLLIFSDAANNSSDVLNEVHHATIGKKKIIPFRIDNSELGDELSYRLGRLHWVNAADCEDSITNLVAYIEEFTCVTMPVVTAQVTDERNANELAEQMPQSHEDYIRLAKKTGKRWGWAYYQAKEKGFETLNSNEAKRIYDDFESVDLPDKSGDIGDVKDTNDDNSDFFKQTFQGVVYEEYLDSYGEEREGNWYMREDHWYKSERLLLTLDGKYVLYIQKVEKDIDDYWGWYTKNEYVVIGDIMCKDSDIENIEADDSCTLRTTELTWEQPCPTENGELFIESIETNIKLQQKILTMLNTEKKQWNNWICEDSQYNLTNDCVSQHGFDFIWVRNITYFLDDGTEIIWKYSGTGKFSSDYVNEGCLLRVAIKTLGYYDEEYEHGIPASNFYLDLYKTIERLVKFYYDKPYSGYFSDKSYIRRVFMLSPSDINPQHENLTNPKTSIKIEVDKILERKSFSESYRESFKIVNRDYMSMDEDELEGLVGDLDTFYGNID